MGEGIAARTESIWRRRPKVARAIGAGAVPAAKAMGKTVAVGFELMPRRAPPLPRRPDTARDRSRRQRRTASILAVLLLLVAGAIGTLAYRDYAANRVGGDYQLAVLSIESEIPAAQRFSDRKPPDLDAARQRLAPAPPGLRADRAPPA